MLNYSFGKNSLESQLDALGIRVAFEKNLTKAVSYADAISASNLPAFACQGSSAPDMAIMMAAAKRIKVGCSDFVLLGTGGSSLGAQAAFALARYRQSVGIRFHTPDSLCPFEMDYLFSSLNPSGTHILVVSKSGSTAETLAQLLVFRAWLEASVGAENLADHFTFITEPGARPLRHYGEALGALVLDHPADIGGRFSVLTKVGMLPALVAGLSAKGFRDGAERVCSSFSDQPAQSAAVVGAVLIHTLHQYRGITQVLIMAYADILRAFTRWQGQLWAESLGKGGLGTTPIRAIGPVDQHSQMQLFLDGPNDKFCTIITVPSLNLGPRIDGADSRAYGLDYMAGRTIGDMVTCESRATQDSLRLQGRMVREIIIDSLSEANLGGLFASFMLETVLTAHLMGVNAFDQPAVEQGKVFTRQYLSELA
ncbi:glucose-6-phosphate isomerase [Simiduia litorea]|uniref:hypothetical protein n=1 Tax=Simiduia litorea TaxID=1435348 RepID=UPI0036F2F8D4